MDNVNLRQLVLKYALVNATGHSGQAQNGAVMGMVMANHPELRSRGKEIGPLTSQVVAQVNGMTLEAQKQKLEELGGYQAPEKKEQEIVEESSEKKDLKKDDRDIDLQNFRRQIMKIQRGEISILPRCEWKLANNNFLLHGYYNYRHLVLIDEGNQLKLGVPGIYHEREARAAATFGFPEFIAEADVNVTLEPQERNENQQFGYWCRQVRRPPR